MKITVEGTPEECNALRDVLIGLNKSDTNVQIEVITVETVASPPPKVPLVVINGGLASRQQRAIELPNLH